VEDKMNKKALEISISILVIALIALASAVIALAIYKVTIGKEAKVTDSLIADKDQDKIIDMSDKCPNKPGIIEYAGCPSKDKLTECENSKEPNAENC